MKEPPAVTSLFVDIGGVLLSNGWDLSVRKAAAMHFHLDLAAIDELHHLTYDTHEEGRLSLDQYLNRVIFTEKRPFTRAEFRDFMFAQSKPFLGMIALIRQLKERHHLKIVVVSNEGRELNANRIKQYRLDEFVDIFVSSCFIHIRKPDEEIFTMALDLAQAKSSQVLYIENTPMFIEIAEGLGIRGILHTDYTSTRSQLVRLGFDCADFSKELS